MFNREATAARPAPARWLLARGGVACDEPGPRRRERCGCLGGAAASASLAADICMTFLMLAINCCRASREAPIFGWRVARGGKENVRSAKRDAACLPFVASNISGWLCWRVSHVNLKDNTSLVFQEGVPEHLPDGIPGRGQLSKAREEPCAQRGRSARKRGRARKRYLFASQASRGSQLTLGAVVLCVRRPHAVHHNERRRSAAGLGGALSS